MKNSNQELQINFDKAEFKDLLLHQIATNIQQHWNTDDVIDLFLHSSFSFVETGKTKAEVVSALMETHKAALKNEIKIEAEI
jgi:hypothetical protein